MKHVGERMVGLKKVTLLCPAQLVNLVTLLRWHEETPGNKIVISTILYPKG